MSFPLSFSRSPMPLPDPLRTRAPKRLLSRAAVLLLGLAFLVAIPAATQSPDSTETAATPVASEQATADARAVAEAWIALIDADAFGRAYDRMQGPVPDTMGRAAWVDALHGARAYVDAPSVREETIAQFRETQPQIEGGPFVSFLYEGEYELGTFSETLLLRSDGAEWHVVMYQILANMPVLRAHEDVPDVLIAYPGDAE